ncbi:MAG: PIN domain-containing protein [Gammaproteobacteria bacterium]|nr:PIN domain-containing protein [Gammaproteobacteria bacterium]
MAGIDRLCWDSCIFYAAPKGEEHRVGELEALKERTRQFNDGQLEILASTLVLTEVRSSKLTEEEYMNFESTMRRSNALLVDVNPRIASLAAELRDKYRTENGKYLSAPDAIHVATAIVFNCEMWTTDAANKKHEAGILTFADSIQQDYGVKLRRPWRQGELL